MFENVRLEEAEVTTPILDRHDIHRQLQDVLAVNQAIVSCNRVLVEALTSGTQATGLQSGVTHEPDCDNARAPETSQLADELHREFAARVSTICRQLMNEDRLREAGRLATVCDDVIRMLQKLAGRTG